MTGVLVPTVVAPTVVAPTVKRSGYRIRKDPSKEFALLVEYRSKMPQMEGRGFVYARCHTQASAEKRYVAMIKEKEGL